MAMVLCKINTKIQSAPGRRRDEYTSNWSWERPTISPKRGKLETNVLSTAPRSCLGFVEKDGGGGACPAYTEVKVQPYEDHLRIGDLVLPAACVSRELHPLPEEGLIWFGIVRSNDMKGNSGYLDDVPGEDEIYGEIPTSQIAYAASTYLCDCDIVFFIRECRRVRGQRNSSNDGFMSLNYWLRSCWMDMSLVPGQRSIPMPVT